MAINFFPAIFNLFRRVSEVVEHQASFDTEAEEYEGSRDAEGK